MNLKFRRHVSERERAIRQFVVVKNKLMSVFNASALLWGGGGEGGGVTPYNGLYGEAPPERLQV